jgi:hypothetical protein
MFLATHGILARPTSGGGFDADAQAFITAAVITDVTQQNAINTLVLDLKGYSIWTKMKAIYPIVGGSASSHKYNLKDPRDLDAAFRLTFATGWTHSATGIKGNGTTAFADSFFNLSTQTTDTNISGGVYVRENTITIGQSFGACTGFFEGLQFFAKYTDNNTYFSANNYILNGSGNFVTDTRGLFVVSKTGATQTQLFRNGSLIRTASPTTVNTPPNINVVIGARRNITVIQNYETREMAFVYFGETLNSTEIANLYTAVQAFQTTLSRQV